MITLQRHQDFRENSQFMAGDGLASAPSLRDEDPCKTKPIRPAVSRSGRVWAGPGASAGDRLCKTKPICRSRQRAGVGRLCKTNPICRPQASRTIANDATRHRATVQNEPNLAQLGHGQVPCGRKMRNEANCAKRTQFRSDGRRAEHPAFHYSIIPPFGSDVFGAKRSQFPGDAGWDEAWGTAARGTLYKQSQFPGRRDRDRGPPFDPRPSGRRPSSLCLCSRAGSGMLKRGPVIAIRWDF